MMLRGLPLALIIYIAGTVPTWWWLRANEGLDPIVGGLIWPLYWIARTIVLAEW